MRPHFFGRAVAACVCACAIARATLTTACFGSNHHSSVDLLSAAVDLLDTVEQHTLNCIGHSESKEGQAMLEMPWSWACHHLLDPRTLPALCVALLNFLNEMVQGPCRSNQQVLPDAPVFVIGCQWLSQFFGLDMCAC